MDKCISLETQSGYTYSVSPVTSVCYHVRSPVTDGFVIGFNALSFNADLLNIHPWNTTVRIHCSIANVCYCSNFDCIPADQRSICSLMHPGVRQLLRMQKLYGHATTY